MILNHTLIFASHMSDQWKLRCGFTICDPIYMETGQAWHCVLHGFFMFLRGPWDGIILNGNFSDSALAVEGKWM